MGHSYPALFKLFKFHPGLGHICMLGIQICPSNDLTILVAYVGLSISICSHFHKKNSTDLKQKMERYSKFGEMKKEEFGRKAYISNMKMDDARLQFRIRTRMIKCKMNQPSDKANKETLWQCTGCGNIDTQSHILWCPAYQGLREGKSLSKDEDLVEYFRKVLAIRETLEL